MIEENSKKEMVKIIILLIFVVSLLAGGFKLYNSILVVNTHQWGSCGISGMSKTERNNCLAKEEHKQQRAADAKIFLKENQETIYILSIICLIGSIVGIVIGKKLKLEPKYFVLGVLSIIFSLILLL